MERQHYCLGLQVIVLQQYLPDEQVAVFTFGREPLAYLDEAPVEVCRPLSIKDVQGAQMPVPVLAIAWL